MAINYLMALPAPDFDGSLSSAIESREPTPSPRGSLPSLLSPGRRSLSAAGIFAGFVVLLMVLPGPVLGTVGYGSAALPVGASPSNTLSATQGLETAGPAALPSSPTPAVTSSASYVFNANNGYGNGRSIWGVAASSLPCTSAGGMTVCAPSTQGFLAYDDGSYAVIHNPGGYSVNAAWYSSGLQWAFSGADSCAASGCGIPYSYQSTGSSGYPNMCIFAPATGKSVAAFIGDSGPAPFTGRYGASQPTLRALGIPVTGDPNSGYANNPNPSATLSISDATPGYSADWVDFVGFTTHAAGSSCSTGSGGGNHGVSYNRAAAVNFAKHFYDLTVPDGYFEADQCTWNLNGNCNIETGPYHFGPAYPLKDQPGDYSLLHGDDCAHFASAVIGTDSYGGYQSGGLNLGPGDAGPSLYGWVNVNGLVTYLENAKIGANVGQNFGAIQPGDLAVFDNGAHVVVFLTGGSYSTATIASHTSSGNGVPFRYEASGFSTYYLVHILSSSSGGTGSPPCPNLVASLPAPSTALAENTPAVTSGVRGNGYWLVGADGGIFSFGQAGFYGSAANQKLNGCIVGMAPTPDGKGYWLVGSDGGVFTYGDAHFYGSMGGKSLAAPVVGIAATPDGKGYWLVARDGGIFSFGDAHFYGSIPGEHLHVSNIVGISALPNGAGYWLVGADGGVFSFGSAHFYGSLPGQGVHVSDIVGMTSDPTGTGYWLVGTDGGVFSFGHAQFYGSLPGEHLHVSNIIGITSTPDGGGYWLGGSDGGVFSLGDAPFFGSMGGKHLNAPVVGIAANPVYASIVPVSFFATSQTSACGSGCNLWATAKLSLTVIGPKGTYGPYSGNTPALALTPGTQYTVRLSVGNPNYVVDSWSANNYATLVLNVGGLAQKYASGCGRAATTPQVRATTVTLQTGTAWGPSCIAAPPLGEHVNVNIGSLVSGSTQCSQPLAVSLGQVVGGSLAGGQCAAFSVTVTQSAWYSYDYLDAYEAEGTSAFSLYSGLAPSLTPATAKQSQPGPDAGITVELFNPNPGQYMGPATYEFLVVAPSGGSGSYCFVAYLANLQVTPASGCSVHFAPTGNAPRPGTATSPLTLSSALPSNLVPVFFPSGTTGTLVGFLGIAFLGSAGLLALLRRTPRRQ